MSPKRKSHHHDCRRRLAVWRRDVRQGVKTSCYISLAGDAILKPHAFRASKQDSDFLWQQLQIQDSGPQSALVHPTLLQPYCEDRLNAVPLQLEYWCIPQGVIRAYLKEGIRSLYEWQADCLQLATKHDVHPLLPPHSVRTAGGADGSSIAALQTGASIVYCAPTSGGKSLCADILVLRTVLFSHRRALIVLPHVALCVEKTNFLQRVWGSTLGLRIASFYAGHGASTSTWSDMVDIGICTIEKANGIINSLLTDGSLHTSIGIVVVDEAHFIGDPHRGYLLEILLSKILWTERHHNPTRTSSRSGYSATTTTTRRIQIVAMSATLPNLCEVRSLTATALLLYYYCTTTVLLLYYYCTTTVLLLYY
eukprot:Lankesteria_metandrocarpae@DN1791_c0_g1_i1.p1